MRIKSFILSAAVAALLFSCGDGEKKAEVRLADAQALFDQGKYNEARAQLDSLKQLYPKAFEARKKSIRLMQQIDLKEQQVTLAYLDSVRTVCAEEFEKVKGDYSFTKNEEYQDYGYYFYPSQDQKRNANRSYLYAQVDENGVMKLVSIYRGKSHIHHNRICVLAGNEEYFAESNTSSNVYESEHLGVKTEKVEYEVGKTDNGVAEYVVANKNARLTLVYEGGKNYKTTIPARDATAIEAVYKLAKILSVKADAEKQAKEARMKIDFITKKMEESDAAS